MYLNEFMNEIKQELDRYGKHEIMQDTYIIEAPELTAEQLDWEDDDEFKNEDFSECFYWVQMNSNEGPYFKGFEIIEEAIIFLFTYC